jgi:ribonuclease P protein component
VFGSHLIARYSTRDGVARFGITVSRKVGNAVVRNRVKRWIREAIRHERGELRGVDLVFIARRSSANAGFSEIQSDVIAALQRARRSQVGSGSDL